MSAKPECYRSLSHREAPEIAKDPVADSTDVYAFASPDKPGTVTLIADLHPAAATGGRTELDEFGDDVLYEIDVDNNGDGREHVSFQFRFRTTVRNPETFLYNTGPIESLDSPNWNLLAELRRVHVRPGPRHRAGLPAVQHRAAVHARLRRAGGQAVHQLGGGITVFAGQRAKPSTSTWVDLRPGRPAAVRDLHATFGLPGLRRAGVNATNHLNVHSIAVQVPVSTLTRSGASVDRRVDDGEPRRVRLWDADNGQNVDSGPFRRCRGSATRWSTRC